MKPAGARPGRTWAWTSIVGVIALAWVAFHVRMPEPRSLPGREAARPSVGLVDSVVIRGTMLRDPTPLFLPTEFNSSRKEYVPPEPEGSFAGFPPKPVFAESELALHLPAGAAVPDSPAEAVAGEPPGAPFLGFGRSDLNVKPLAPRGAYVEITDAGSGRSVFGRPVMDAHPPSSESWRPVEFMAAVDAAGLVGPLVLTARSEVADVDAYFGRYLADTLRVGQRLAPGFYRISVGP
jgi:hypothetical protein